MTTSMEASPFPPTYSTISLPGTRTTPPPPSPAKAPASAPAPPAPIYTEEKGERGSTDILKHTVSEDDPASYIRDPHKLVGYLIPFPSPNTFDSHHTPTRFLVYTPPPPPLLKLAPGEKESTTHKLQRKWQKELRMAKTKNAKLLSVKGIRGRVAKTTEWAANRVTSADLEFVNRIPIDKRPKAAKTNGKSSPTPSDGSVDVEMGEPTAEAGRIKLEEMVLVYPPSLDMSELDLRRELVESLGRTRTKAQRDAIVSTSLLPFSFATDLVLAHVGAPGGLTQFNGGWAALSLRGAKSARSITKRLALSANEQDVEESGEQDPTNPKAELQNLKLVFHSSPRVEILREYLAAKCTDRNDKLFNAAAGSSEATDTDVPMIGENEVLEAIGWQPSGQTSMEERNWEDEAWERQQVEEDLEEVMKKAAKTWEEWVQLHAKHPKRASKQ
jgi:hypothetical protein